MSKLARPAIKPANPCFSSGPCRKRPGWSTEGLKGAFLSRSHRSSEGKARLKLAIDRTREVLEVPAPFRIAIMPASDTGAFEAAMWNLLGPRGVDVLAWESFGRGWVTDIAGQLKLSDVRELVADYGDLPELSAVDFARDVVFTMNGTTSGVRVPDFDWVAADRGGLTLVDATSGAFAQPIDWSKADALTFSWQKVLGGEAAHGILILSPRAIERLQTYTPGWPMPKIFRLKKDGELIDGIFSGETINTPSMLAVEDYLDALAWAQDQGGLEGLMARADANAQVLFDWIDATGWVANLAKDPATYSNTSVCLRITDPRVAALDHDGQAAFARSMAALLDREEAAKDIAFYRDAPPGLRIWTGATVETADVTALLPWLDWAFEECAANLPDTD